MNTVIITAFKEEKTIGRAIKAILSQIEKNDELIVVAPDEPTIQQAKKFERVKIVNDPGKGKPHALNLSFKKAKGNIIILTDGDVIIQKNSIPKLLKHFKNSKVGAASSRVVCENPKNDMLGWWANFLSEAGAHENKKRLSKKGFLICSGEFYAIRNVIKKIPEQSLADDAVISHMIREKGYKIVYEPDAWVKVRYPDNFKDWVKQKRRTMAGYHQIQKWFPGHRTRSFLKESSHFTKGFGYAKNLKELVWYFALITARTYAWALSFIDLNIKKKDLKQIWEKAETARIK